MVVKCTKQYYFHQYHCNLVIKMMFNIICGYFHHQKPEGILYIEKL